METDEGNLVRRLRLFCMLACNPDLDSGFRMMVQQQITMRLERMPLPLLERLALHEENEGFRRAAGLIYAWKLGNSLSVVRGERICKLNALISAEGAFPEVIGYVKNSLSHLLGWPLEAWNTMMDEGKPEEERVNSSREVAPYCKQNGYLDVLHRIARDAKMPMRAREVAMCALIEVQMGWDGDQMSILEMARTFIGDGTGPNPWVDNMLACSEFIKNTDMERNVSIFWDKAKRPVLLKDERPEGVRAKLFK